MKILEAKTRFEDNYSGLVEIRENPARISEYMIMLHSVDGKSFMLCSEDDSVISFPELEHFVLMFKQVGFKQAKIYF